MRRLGGAVAVATLFGCLDPVARPCSENSECALDGVQGVCRDHCAYADPNCESGERYGPFAPEGIAKTCVPAEVCVGDECDPEPDAGTDEEAGGEEIAVFELAEPDIAIVANAFALGPAYDVCIAGHRGNADAAAPWVGRFEADGEVVFETTASAWERPGEAFGCGFSADGAIVVAAGSTTGASSGAWLRGYADDGALRWSAEVDTSDDDELHGVAVVDDHVVVAGRVAGLGTVEARTLDGTFAWAEPVDVVPRSIDGRSGPALVAASAGPNEPLTWFAEYRGRGGRDTNAWRELQLPAQPVHAVARGRDGTLVVGGGELGAGWLVAYASDGRSRWDTVTGGEVRGIAIDGSGDVVAVGVTTSEGLVRGLLERFDATGAPVWARQIGDDDPRSHTAHAVAFADDGTIRVLGTAGAAGGGVSTWVRSFSP